MRGPVLDRVRRLPLASLAVIGRRQRGAASCRRSRCWIVRYSVSVLMSTAVVTACDDGVSVTEHLEASQIVYVRPGRSGNQVSILAGQGGGVLHIDAECIVLELNEPDDPYAGLYTVLFDDNGRVSVASPTGPLTIRDRPPAASAPNDSEGTAGAFEVTIADGDEVIFTYPNAWQPEHLGEDSLAFVTLPHESCPQQFWFPGHRGLEPAAE